MQDGMVENMFQSNLCENLEKFPTVNHGSFSNIHNDSKWGFKGGSMQMRCFRVWKSKWVTYSIALPLVGNIGGDAIIK